MRTYTNASPNVAMPKRKEPVVAQEVRPGTAAYIKLVKASRSHVSAIHTAEDTADAQATDAKFALGDAALVVWPATGRNVSNAEKTAGREALASFAEDIGVNVSTLEDYRKVSDKWPADRRVAGTSWRAHRELMPTANEPDRWELLKPGMTLTQASKAAGRVQPSRDADDRAAAIEQAKADAIAEANRIAAAEREADNIRFQEEKEEAERKAEERGRKAGRAEYLAGAEQTEKIKDAREQIAGSLGTPGLGQFNAAEVAFTKAIGYLEDAEAACSDIEFSGDHIELLARSLDRVETQIASIRKALGLSTEWDTAEL
jgi:hypothetical protein